MSRVPNNSHPGRGESTALTWVGAGVGFSPGARFFVGLNSAVSLIRRRLAGREQEHRPSVGDRPRSTPHNARETVAYTELCRTLLGLSVEAEAQGPLGQATRTGYEVVTSFRARALTDGVAPAEPERVLQAKEILSRVLVTGTLASFECAGRRYWAPVLEVYRHTTFGVETAVSAPIVPTGALLDCHCLVCRGIARAHG